MTLHEAIVEVREENTRLRAALACAYALGWALRTGAGVDGGSVDDALDDALRRLGMDPARLRFDGAAATTESLRAMLRGAP